MTPEEVHMPESSNERCTHAGLECGLCGESMVRSRLNAEGGRESKDDKEWTDWTRADDGRSNSSPLFNELVERVAALIRGDAFMLMSGRADNTAALIVAQLAHVHHLIPALLASPTDSQEERCPTCGSTRDKRGYPDSTSVCRNDRFHE